SNLPVASHAWAAGGTYPVVLRAYNDTFPSGLSATTSVHVVANPVQYVVQSNGSPAAPFTSWATAATNIQDAVNVGFVGGTILVSNGTYQAGGQVRGEGFNRVATTRPMLLQSVNGPGATVIDGAHSVRCAYLANGSVLSGFTLASGTNFGIGGGLR